jgi:uncharacterized Fe-S cluster protein YjdI/CDGSH-type Zn-finger protein
MRRTYHGERIEVSFDLGLCTHVAACLLGLPAVFVLERRPWIEPNAAAPDEIARTIERCPSGALQYRRLDGGSQEHGPETTEVTPIRNGPLRVRGRVEVRRADGSLEVLPRASLCRCGASESKPFCDNSHLRIGFKAPGDPVRIELSPVRPALDRPITRERDPRA